MNPEQLRELIEKDENCDDDTYAALIGKLNPLFLELWEAAETTHSDEDEGTPLCRALTALEEA